MIWETGRPVRRNMGPNNVSGIIWALGEFFFLPLFYSILTKVLLVLNYGKWLPCHLHTTDIVHNNKRQAVRINNGWWGQTTWTGREDMKEKKKKKKKNGPRDVNNISWAVHRLIECHHTI